MTVDEITLREKVKTNKTLKFTCNKFSQSRAASTGWIMQINIDVSYHDSVLFLLCRDGRRYSVTSSFQRYNPSARWFHATNLAGLPASL